MEFISGTNLVGLPRDAGFQTLSVQARHVGWSGLHTAQAQAKGMRGAEILPQLMEPWVPTRLCQPQEKDCVSASGHLFTICLEASAGS